jgi:hypothetical protein
MLWGICESASTTERAWYTESHGSSQSPNFCFTESYVCKIQRFPAKTEPPKKERQDPKRGTTGTPRRMTLRIHPTWRPVGNLRRGLARLELTGPTLGVFHGFSPSINQSNGVSYNTYYANQHDGEDPTQPYSTHLFYQFWPEQMMISQFCIYIYIDIMIYP